MVKYLKIIINLIIYLKIKKMTRIRYPIKLIKKLVVKIFKLKLNGGILYLTRGICFFIG